MVNEEWTVCFENYRGQEIGFHIAARPHGSAKPVCAMEQSVHAIENRPREKNWQPEEVRRFGRLVSAAPDLLKAAIMGLEALDAVMPSNHGLAEDLAVRAAFDALERAIAKAEGRIRPEDQGSPQ